MNVKAGALFVAALEWIGDGSVPTPVLVATERLQANAGLGDADKLADLRDRVRQFLSPLHLDQVALMETRQFAQLKYADAYSRVTRICAAMDASHALRIPFSTEKTGDVARTLQLDATKLQLFEATRVGRSVRPTYWTTGLSEAAAVAMHVLGDPAAPGEGEAS